MRKSLCSCRRETYAFVSVDLCTSFLIRARNTIPLPIDRPVKHTRRKREHRPADGTRSEERRHSRGVRGCGLHARATRPVYGPTACVNGHPSVAFASDKSLFVRRSSSYNLLTNSLLSSRRNKARWTIAERYVPDPACTPWRYATTGTESPDRSTIRRLCASLHRRRGESTPRDPDADFRIASIICDRVQ